MAKKQDVQLTSVKVNSKLFDDFKVYSIRSKFSLQKLVDRAMFLYLKDEEFRKTLHNQLDTLYSGSV